MTVRNALTRMGARTMTAGLAVLVGAFCLSSVAPAAAADSGCRGYEASSEICGQSGAFDPLPEVISQVLPVQRTEAPAAWLALTPLPGSVSQSHADPSTPRAPPLSLV